jgi:hypothetical protein
MGASDATHAAIIEPWACLTKPPSQGKREQRERAKSSPRRPNGELAGCHCLSRRVCPSHRPFHLPKTPATKTTTPIHDDSVTAPRRLHRDSAFRMRRASCTCDCMPNPDQSAACPGGTAAGGAEDSACSSKQLQSVPGAVLAVTR